MGSEMCIRDRLINNTWDAVNRQFDSAKRIRDSSYQEVRFSFVVVKSPG